MPEQIPNPFNAIVDPSAANLTAAVSESYMDMNRLIAKNKADYGNSLQRPHLMLSQRTIRKTAQAALQRTRAGDERTAIILGPGGCFDIPLEEIVTDFDKTTLVDIETSHTENALSNLPAKLLGKISLHKADVTNGIAELCQTVERASKSRNYRGFIPAAATAVQALAKRQASTKLEGSYSFVCSQLVMSQLSSLPVLYLRDFVQDRFGTPLSAVPGAADEPLLRALNDYNVQVQTDHIDQLAELTRSNGTAHFADTLAEIKDGRALYMTSSEPIKRIQQHFTHLHDPHTWEWRAAPQRTFSVAAFALARRVAN